jgi:hypothetical protein
MRLKSALSCEIDTFDGAKPRFLNRGKKRRSVSTLSIPRASDRGVEWVDFENRCIGKSPYVPLCLSMTGKRLPKGEIGNLPFVKGDLEGFCQSCPMLL